MNDKNSAFCRDTVQVIPTGQGTLTGMRFGIKDVVDVAGRVTNCGDPDWRRTHLPDTAHVAVVTALLAAGAEMTGQPVTDELAYSFNGKNLHDGTPPNPRAPGRIPDSSSAGSASAVAADQIDFAIGTDGGGSIRMQASFCGLYGLQPTHSDVDVSGLVALASGFDNVDWFAASTDTLCRVGGVLLASTPPLQPHP